MRALRVNKEVESTGIIHLESLPFNEGQTVEVTLLPIDDDLNDLVRLSESGLDFWRNDVDDQVWNDALPST
ncbi:MAG: hypothetical protein ACE5EC_04025 [Phycisphaerae bacterium]